MSQILPRSLTHACCRGLAVLSLLVLGGAAFAAGDPVVASAWGKTNPDAQTLFRGGGSIGNAYGNWGIQLSNWRAHGTRGRYFEMLLNSGRQACGYCGLIHAVKLTVNGISWERLQVKPESVRKWSEGAREGVEYAFNFDGAPVRLRASMTPDSKWLDFEVAPLPGGQTPVTNVVVGVAAIPSYLDCGHKKPTRFDKYRRSVQTAARYLKPQKTGSVRMTPEDRYFIFMDEDYDGSAKDKGMGPSVVRPEKPVAGSVTLNDSWVTSVWFTPKPDEPFRFSVYENVNRRIANRDFVSELSSEK